MLTTVSSEALLSLKSPLWRVPLAHSLPLFHREAEAAETFAKSKVVTVRVGE